MPASATTSPVPAPSSVAIGAIEPSISAQLLAADLC